jgi:outer membrane immunogenic protein
MDAMKKLLLAGVGAAVLAAAPVRAADLPAAPVAAPVVAPAAWSWTGFHIGGNGGYSWGSSDANGAVTLAASVNGVPFGPLLTPQTAGGANSVNGWIAGGQAGFNWQTGALVLGIEADIQSTGQRGSNVFCTNVLAGACPAIVGFPLFGFSPFTLNVDEKLAWFGTARARIGAGGDRFLFYLTGGAAVGEIKADYMAAGPFAPAPASVSASTNFTKVGWVVGGGVEARVADNWTVKLEYLHMDLGSYSNTLTATGSIGAAVATATTTFSSRLTDDIVRVGLNYKFWWADPVVARY